MNTVKSTRGIQESDVWEAADALIAQGLRPTIERVRQHIGRGSPNTVSPMLEAWFATLGARLGVSADGAVQEKAPEPVIQAAQSMWVAALTEASEAAKKMLQDREQTVVESEQALEKATKKLEQREQLLEQQKKAVEDALELARNQVDDLNKRLQTAQSQLAERDTQITQLRDALADKDIQREKDHEQHRAALETAAQERQRLAEQFAGNERRMLADLDRVRQDFGQQKKQQQESEKRAAQKYEELHGRFVESEEALIQSRSQLMTAEQSLRAALDRIEDLRAMHAAQVKLQASLVDDGVPSVRTKPVRPLARARAIPSKTLRKNKLK